MAPERHLEVWQGCLQKSVYGGNQEELAETAPGGGSIGGGWQWWTVATMGQGRGAGRVSEDTLRQG